MDCKSVWHEEFGYSQSWPTDVSQKIQFACILLLIKFGKFDKVYCRIEAFNHDGFNGSDHILFADIEEVYIGIESTAFNWILAEAV